MWKICVFVHVVLGSVGAPFLNLLLIIRIILFSVLVDVAAKAAKQDSKKEKMRKPEEGTASIAAFCWLCAFLLSFCHIMLNTKTLELPFIYTFTVDRVGDKGIFVHDGI